MRYNFQPQFLGLCTPLKSSVFKCSVIKLASLRVRMFSIEIACSPQGRRESRTERDNCPHTGGGRTLPTSSLDSKD